MQKTPARTTLFYGDNLAILREHIEDESLNPAMVKDLIVTADQEGAKMGVFLTLEPPTKGMVTQAAAAGFFKPEGDQQWQKPFPKIQIVTVAQLFQPSNPLHLPLQDTSVFKKAKRENRQNEMDL